MVEVCTLGVLLVWELLDQIINTSMALVFVLSFSMTLVLCMNWYLKHFHPFQSLVSMLSQDTAEILNGNAVIWLSWLHADVLPDDWLHLTYHGPYKMVFNLQATFSDFDFFIKIFWFWLKCMRFHSHNYTFLRHVTLPQTTSLDTISACLILNHVRYVPWSVNMALSCFPL